jgi:hypothetical protein
MRATAATAGKATFDREGGDDGSSRHSGHRLDRFAGAAGRPGPGRVTMNPLARLPAAGMRRSRSHVPKRYGVPESE